MYVTVLSRAFRVRQNKVPIYYRRWVMGFGRIVGGSFLGAMGANLLNDAIMGGFHRQQQFSYPYAYGPQAFNPGYSGYGGNPGGDYAAQFLPQQQQFWQQEQFLRQQAAFQQQQRWGTPQYPWGNPNGGYDQGRNLNPNPAGLSEFDEGGFAADQTLAKKNLCGAVQAIHDCEVMDAMTQRHFPGFNSHYARDMFNLEKQRLRAQGYDLRYHQCQDNPNYREFGIFDRGGNLVDRMRVAKLQQNEIPNNDIRPVVS